jgi:hypothetical protein
MFRIFLLSSGVVNMHHTIIVVQENSGEQYGSWGNDCTMNFKNIFRIIN